MSSFYRLGLIGQNVQHSLSPLIHEYWLKLYGIRGNYNLLECEETDLTNLMKSLSSNGFWGVNVTMPHKTNILAYVDQADPSVQKIKAANTLTFLQDGLIQANNTDISGVVQVLTQHNLNPQKAIIYGAGGAAKAVAYALIQNDVEAVFIISRNPKKSENDFHFLSGKIKVVGEDFYQKTSESADLLINASPLGMVGHPPFSAPLDGLSEGVCIMDLVYHPRKTKLLQDAIECGFLTIEGIDLLLAQAQHSFNHWFDIMPEVTSELREMLLN